MGFDVQGALKSAWHAEKVGKEVYRKLLPKLKAEHLQGSYIAINVSSEDYLTAKTELELMHLCDKWGDAPAWVQRIEDDQSEADDRPSRSS